MVEINYMDDSDEYLARILGIVNAKVIDNETPALPPPEDGQEYGSSEEVTDEVTVIIEESG